MGLIRTVLEKETILSNLQLCPMGSEVKLLDVQNLGDILSGLVVNSLH